jgi:hypothetical protein
MRRQPPLSRRRIRNVQRVRKADRCALLAGQPQTTNLVFVCIGEHAHRLIMSVDTR